MKTLVLLTFAYSFDASCNGGNMVFVYYDEHAGPTEFIMIKLLQTFYDYHENFA